MYPQPQKSANGAVILVLGILAWVGFSCITGIPAWIMGNAALRDIDSGYADPNERGLVQAGRILGMINVIIIASLVFGWLAIAALIALIAGVSH